MQSDALFTLTVITDFLILAVSLWFAIYLLARSQLNDLTFRAVAALLAVAFYYHGSFSRTVSPGAGSPAVRSLAVIVALVAVHDLTYYLLPTDLRKKRYWIARGIIVLGVIGIVLLLGVAGKGDCDPRFICPVDLQSNWVLINLAVFLVFLAILYNLWQIRSSGNRLLNISFTFAVLVGISTIGYAFVGTIFNVDLPRTVSNLLILSALSLLAYSVARHQDLVSRRTTPFDLPITMLTTLGILGIYVLVAWQIELPLTELILIAVLVIFTHSAYDFMREFLNRLFRRQERSVLRELRYLARKSREDKSLQRFLRRGLVILCQNLEASSGFVAVRSGNQYAVEASLHSVTVGTAFPLDRVEMEGVSPPSGGFVQDVSWLVPVFGGGEQVAVIGLGERRGVKEYTDDDVYWLEEIADQFGALIFSHNRKIKNQFRVVPAPSNMEKSTITQEVETEELLTTLAYRPDPTLVKCVEEGFRNIHDYSKLGRSPLVELFGVQAESHIECGKIVQQKLIETLESLRPDGNPPSEPLPREWYSYTILYDAYVDDRPSRDIMAKLYISEGTYYRTRRRALRGVSRALVETGIAV
jgi:hypothetical protein